MVSVHQVGIGVGRWSLYTRWVRWSLYTRWVLGEVGGLCTPGGYWGSLNFSKRKQELCIGIVGPEEVLCCNIWKPIHI